MARIEHFALFCEDLDALRAFYTEALGLRVIVDNSKAKVRGYFLTDDGGSVLEIIARPPGTPAPDTRFGSHAAFWVENYDRSRRDLESRGARFETDSEVLSDTIKTGFFDDPQGNRLQIVWRAKPLGE